MSKHTVRPAMLEKMPVGQAGTVKQVSEPRKGSILEQLAISPSPGMHKQLTEVFAYVFRATASTQKKTESQPELYRHEPPIPAQRATGRTRRSRRTIGEGRIVNVAVLERGGEGMDVG